MVGDPNQLPPTIFSGINAYARSLFERMQKAGVKSHRLTIQYRMHPEIRKFPSKYFYQDQLTDGPNIKDYKQPFYNSTYFGPYFLFDIEGKELRGADVSYENDNEVQFIVKFLLQFQLSYFSLGVYSFN